MLKQTQLNDTEACIHLGITKELLYAYVRYAPKKHLKHNRKLISIVEDGKNLFEKDELDKFDDYLKEPWSEKGDKRPDIPKYIQDYLRAEIRGKCPITDKGFPLENAHIEDYHISRNHHHHNIIRIAKDEHTKADAGIISKDVLKDSKEKLIEEVRQKMMSKHMDTKIVTFLPNINIVDIKGRSEEIEKIHNSLKKYNRVTIVNGIGGIGKTSLVQLYSQLYHDSYDYFIWVGFPNVTKDDDAKDIFMSEFVNNFLIQDFLGISSVKGTPLKNQFELVLKKLKQLKGKKLLVLDNVPNVFSQFHTQFLNSKDWDIIGTSRSIIEDFAYIDIDVL